MKKKKWIFIGIVVILLTVFLILSGVFYPRYRAKSDMKEILISAAHPEIQYMRAVDPSYERPGFMDGDGREIVLEGELFSFVQGELSAFAEELVLEQITDARANKLTMYLLFKKADGTVHSIYVGMDMLYIVQDEKTLYFSLKDKARYESFYQMITRALSTAE